MATVRIERARAGHNAGSGPGRRGGIALLAVLAVLLIAACGGGASDGSEPNPTATAVVPQVPLEVGSITWAAAQDPDTGAPLEPLTALPNTAEAVVAVLDVPSLPAGTTVQARWTIDGDPLPNLTPDPIETTEPLEEAWLGWRLEWQGAEPWPIGTLGIVVEMDGQEVARAEVRIVWATG